MLGKGLDGGSLLSSKNMGTSRSRTGILQHCKGILEDTRLPKVPSVEAFGVLGHGMLTALGVALGLKIKAMPNKVFCLVGDGECHEGTIWEGANVAANMNLGNFCVIVDWNQSAAQLTKGRLTGKWRDLAGCYEIDGHSTNELKSKLRRLGTRRVMCRRLLLLIQ